MNVVDVQDIEPPFRSETIRGLLLIVFEFKGIGVVVEQ